MKQKFGLQINNKAEADLISLALESYASSNPQARTVIFSDIMRRLSILQNNLGKIELVEDRIKQKEIQLKQHQNQRTNLPRGNPLPPSSQKTNIRQSVQVQQRNQKINLPKR